MAAKTVPTRLSAVAPAGGDLTAMEDIQNRDLRLVCAEQRETQFGEGFLMSLIDDGTDEAFEVLTSAKVVVQQLKKALENDPFDEMIVRFEKRTTAKGQNCWVIV